MLIAFTGKMGSGKSTAIGLLGDAVNQVPKLVKFAGALYKMQELIYNVAGLPQPQPKDRKLLQWLGTEWGRSIDSNLWVNIWKNRVLELAGNNPNKVKSASTLIVADDCRFDNEAVAVQEMGGTIIKIETSDSVRSDRIKLENEGHASEKGVDNKYIFATLNNDGDLGALRVQILNLIENLKKKENNHGVY